MLIIINAIPIGRKTPILSPIAPTIMKRSPLIIKSVAAVLILFASSITLLAILFRDGILPQQINHYFRGENMENLSDLGIFLGGLGFLLLSCGLFWWVSLYDKFNKSKQNEGK